MWVGEKWGIVDGYSGIVNRHRVLPFCYVLINNFEIYLYKQEFVSAMVVLDYGAYGKSNISCSVGRNRLQKKTVQLDSCHKTVWSKM